MIELNSILNNKIKDSVGTGRQLNSNPGIADFNKLLLELKMKQAEALSGFLGDESDSKIDPGYQALLLNSLKSLGSQRGLGSNHALKNYQDIAVPQASSPAKSMSLHDLLGVSAQKHDIPQQWFEKLINQESSFKPGAISAKGAMGLGQLMPATAKELGLRVDSPSDPGVGSVWNPASNLDASARYLRQLYNRYTNMGIDTNEAWKFAAGAYNAGMGNIQKAIDLIDSDEPLEWDKVVGVLEKVTGKNAQETINYVSKLSSNSAES